MPTHNPLDILLAHNHWATRNILDACAKLTPDQFHRRFEMGHGSLHDTVTHLLAAQRSWADMLAGRDPRPRLEGTQRSIPDLLMHLDDIGSDLIVTAAKHPVDQVVSGSRGGKPYSFTRGGVLTHITTHGMHHRAQCLNMLRHVGVSPLPQSSVLEWMLVVDR